jgi:hypothetical protein
VFVVATINVSIIIVRVDVDVGGEKLLCVYVLFVLDILFYICVCVYVEGTKRIRPPDSLSTLPKAYCSTARSATSHPPVPLLLLLSLFLSHFPY